MVELVVQVVVMLMDVLEVQAVVEDTMEVPQVQVITLL